MTNKTSTIIDRRFVHPAVAEDAAQSSRWNSLTKNQRGLIIGAIAALPLVAFNVIDNKALKIYDKFYQGTPAGQKDNSPQIRHYSADEIADLPTVTGVPVAPGETPIDVARKINPDSITGPESSEQETDALVDMIMEKAPNDGVLQASEVGEGGQLINTAEVAIIPGRQNESTSTLVQTAGAIAAEASRQIAGTQTTPMP